jgi:hypothetical protein
MENDIDDEIEYVKISYDKELKFLNEYANRLIITVCLKKTIRHDFSLE